MDSSGERLHRRGWRTEGGEAPLRESLAAALLALAEWNPAEALVDPMCGAGTIAIEACTTALNIAPGLRRSFAFERWPLCHGPALERWASISGRGGSGPPPGPARADRRQRSGRRRRVLHPSQRRARRRRPANGRGGTGTRRRAGARRPLAFSSPTRLTVNVWELARSCRGFTATSASWCGGASADGGAPSWCPTRDWPLPFAYRYRRRTLSFMVACVSPFCVSDLPPASLGNLIKPPIKPPIEPPGGA